MNCKFDELVNKLANSVARRTVLKKFSPGLAGTLLACFGLPNPLHAANPTFASIDYPGESGTLALDINASGQ
jgi:hypothetical protein